MKKLMAMLVLALACAGCFDNKGKPEDVPTVIGMAQLMSSSNRAEIVRVILRGDKSAIPEAAFAGLDSVKMVDLSERGTKDVPPQVLALKGVKEFYFVRNGMEKLVDLTAWASTLDYLNLDSNAISELPDSVAALVNLKWLRLNENKLASLPRSLASLKNLRRIYLKKNSLKEVPAVIREWPMIEEISLDGNPIKEIPEWLVSMPKLRGLSLSGTGVSALPADLSAWRDLDFLALGSCPISKEEMRRIRECLPDVAIVF